VLGRGAGGYSAAVVVAVVVGAGRRLRPQRWQLLRQLRNLMCLYVGGSAENSAAAAAVVGGGVGVGWAVRVSKAARASEKTDTNSAQHVHASENAKESNVT